jgi:glucan phosphoethanolaminetransferase (alkaline phosphatase superfamily)
VYFFLLSLLPLRPTVATLQSALDVRQRLELGNKSPGSHTVAQKAVLITAIMGLIFALLPTLQQLTKVLHLRSEYFCSTVRHVHCSASVVVADFTSFAALRRLLVHEIVTLSLLAMWAASYFYVLFNIVTSVDYIPEEDGEYLFGYTMTIIPFALLLPWIEESVIGKRLSITIINNEKVD